MLLIRIFMHFKRNVSDSQHAVRSCHSMPRSSPPSVGTEAPCAVELTTP